LGDPANAVDEAFDPMYVEGIVDDDWHDKLQFYHQWYKQ
jgi:hypothetical protein